MHTRTPEEEAETDRIIGVILAAAAEVKHERQRRGRWARRFNRVLPQGLWRVLFARRYFRDIVPAHYVWNARRHTYEDLTDYAAAELRSMQHSRATAQNQVEAMDAAIEAHPSKAKGARR